MGKDVIRELMLEFQSQCLEKVRDRKLDFGPRQLKEGCLYLELVLIFASSVRITIMFHSFCEEHSYTIRVINHIQITKCAYVW